MRPPWAEPLAAVLSPATRGSLSLYSEARDCCEATLQDWERDGRHYDGRVSALRDRRGTPRGTVLVLRDTTDRRIAEMALDDAKRELESRVVERTAQLAAEKEHLAHLDAVAGGDRPLRDQRRTPRGSAPGWPATPWGPRVTASGSAPGTVTPNSSRARA